MNNISKKYSVKSHYSVLISTEKSLGLYADVSFFEELGKRIANAYDIDEQLIDVIDIYSLSSKFYVYINGQYHSWCKWKKLKSKYLKEIK